MNFKSIFNILSLIIVLLSFACTQEAEQETSAETAKSAMELMQASADEFAAAWKAGDSNAIGEVFTEDAIQVVGSAQIPALGRASIAGGFAAAFSQEGPFHNTHIEIKINEARKLNDDIMIAAGYWNVLDESNESLLDGKWGNVYEIQDNRIEFIQEAAYSSADQVDMANLSERITHPVMEASESENYTAISSNVDSFLSLYNSGDFKTLATTVFIEDGIRVVSGVKEICIGPDAIAKSFNAENSSAKLDAHICGMRDLGNSLVIAHGQWSETNEDGSLSAFGQWGNLFQVKDGTAKMVMESAGMYNNKFE